MTLAPATAEEYKSLRKFFIDALPFKPLDRIVAKWKALDSGPGVAGGEVFSHKWSVKTSPLDKVTGFTFSSYSDGPDTIRMYVDSNRNKRFDRKDEQIVLARTTEDNTDSFTNKVDNGKGKFSFILGAKKGGEGAGFEYPIIKFNGVATPKLDQLGRPVSAWYGIQYVMAEASKLI